MLNRVANDKNIKGVIVRIDSPGGEVPASDDMWRAMNELHKKKPVVISMSDDAASGGYYMAMSGDTLVAYPGTITGSIGVVFGKANLHGLYDKLGITKDSVSRGRFARIESDYESLSDAERAKLREDIDSDYEDFVGKVAAARKKPVSVIEPLAQGRVWLGDQAKANGLVDELGGLDRAIELIKAKSGIPAGKKVSLVLYPAKRSVFDLLFRSNPDAEADAMLSGVGLAPLRSGVARRQSARVDARRHAPDDAFFDSNQVAVRYKRLQSRSPGGKETRLKPHIPLPLWLPWGILKSDVRTRCKEHLSLGFPLLRRFYAGTRVRSDGREHGGKLLLLHRSSGPAGLRPEASAHRSRPGRRHRPAHSSRPDRPLSGGRRILLALGPLRPDCHHFAGRHPAQQRKAVSLPLGRVHAAHPARSSRPADYRRKRAESRARYRCQSRSDAGRSGSRS